MADVGQNIFRECLQGPNLIKVDTAVGIEVAGTDSPILQGRGP